VRQGDSDQQQRRVQRCPGRPRENGRGNPCGDRSDSRLKRRDAEHRQQPGRRSAQQPGRQQGQRIQILRAAQQPPVQTARRTVRRARLDGRHHLAGAHLRSLGEQRAHGFVRRAQRRFTRTGEGEGEDAAARDPAREEDPAGRRRPHRGARRRGQIHAAVPRPVHRVRWLPAAYDGGPRRTHRPAPVAIEGRRRGRAHNEQGSGKGNDNGDYRYEKSADESADEAVHATDRPAEPGNRVDHGPDLWSTDRLWTAPSPGTAPVPYTSSGDPGHRVDFARPATTPSSGRWPRSSVPCGTARRGVRT
jgi:hypothetical protein